MGENARKPQEGWKEMDTFMDEPGVDEPGDEENNIGLYIGKGIREEIPADILGEGVGGRKNIEEIPANIPINTSSEMPKNNPPQQDQRSPRSPLGYRLSSEELAPFGEEGEVIENRTEESEPIDERDEDTSDEPTGLGEISFLQDDIAMRRKKEITKSIAEGVPAVEAFFKRDIDPISPEIAENDFFRRGDEQHP